MLENRVPVRHASDVVGDRSGAAGGTVRTLGLQGEVAVLGRHEAHVLEEAFEELLDHPPRLGCHPQDLVVAIDVLAQEGLQLQMLLVAGVAQHRQRLGVHAYLIDRARLHLRQLSLRGPDEVDHQVVDHAADDLVHQAALVELRVMRDHRLVLASEHAYLAQSREVEQLCTDSVVHVVVVVGDLIGKVGDLCLEARLSALDEPLTQLPELARVAQRAVLEDPFAALESEVKSTKGRVALLELIHDPQRLQVVLEAAVVAHALIQRVLAGMAEGSMSQVVSETDRLGERLIQPERECDRARDLRHLDRVRDACAVQVALVVDEHLGLVDEAAESVGVDDAIAVALELAAKLRLRLGVVPSARLLIVRCVRGERPSNRDIVHARPPTYVARVRASVSGG